MITEDKPYHHHQHHHRHHDHHYQILLNDSHAFHRGVSVRKEKKISARYMSQHDSDDGDDDDDGDVDGV